MGTGKQGLTIMSIPTPEEQYKQQLLLYEDTETATLWRILTLLTEKLRTKGAVARDTAHSNEIFEKDYIIDILVGRGTTIEHVDDVLETEVRKQPIRE